MAFDGTIPTYRVTVIDGASFALSACGRFYDAGGVWFRVPDGTGWGEAMRDARDNAFNHRTECRSGGATEYGDQV